MSAESIPISAARFAEAITTLPFGNLHLKAAELRNSIAHLESSNEQLKEFAEQGDRDCEEAIQENVVVMAKMRERIGLLKAEVERRGFRWEEEDDAKDETQDGSGHLPDETASNANPENTAQHEQAARVEGENGTGSGGPRVGGSLTDEDLERRLRERMEDDIEDDGVYL